MAKFVREICKRIIEALDIRFGGPNAIVEVDESAVSRLKKNVVHIVRTRCIFGIWDRTTKTGYIEEV